MIEKQTAVIVGSGASAECGLPTGPDLKRKIADLLNFGFPDGHTPQISDTTINMALHILAKRNTPPDQNFTPYLTAAKHIRDAMPQAHSIDNFIDTQLGNRRLEQCGKLAIIRAVLEAEKKSGMYFIVERGKLSPDFAALEKTWFTAFFQLLTENCRVDDIEDRLAKLTLIIFNYDRCVEHFLYYSLQNYYRINQEDAARLVSRLTIFHPYGIVGSLSWQKQPVSVDFGADPEPEQLVKLADQIRTFREGTNPNTSQIETIRAKFLEAQIVLFLGFAYHRQNLALLKSNGMQHKERFYVKYFGTALGSSASDRDAITDELAILAGAELEKIAIRNELTCFQLFGEYSRNLSMA